jgi:hypothetical protein
MNTPKLYPPRSFEFLSPYAYQDINNQWQNFTDFHVTARAHFDTDGEIRDVEIDSVMWDDKEVSALIAVTNDKLWEELETKAWSLAKETFIPIETGE